jgi:hypothetical protein
VNAGALDGRSELGEGVRGEGQGALEAERVGNRVRGDEGERDSRHIALFAPKAGPEGRLDHGLDSRGFDGGVVA